ncbi:hypothetical protein IWQ62_003122 [Dispira parvispora]|uniref:Lytic polysaccharide monooxygenase n=1 Tax=Dispira parvispora TaxID=1520584 RepID=A0A9W8AUR7_9FUNG|nr:hypothetical protein IWQ62_003122 [Dispira parvispora]
MVKLNRVSFVLATLVSTALGHMNIHKPCIPFANNDKCDGYGDRDNHISYPMASAYQYDKKNGVENNFGMCRGLPNKLAGTWNAGSTVPIIYKNYGNHKGGHCDWAVSYNGGKTFVAFLTILKDCMADATGGEGSKYTYNLKLPKGLPASDNAIISWTWVNAEGHRELYWNCFAVKIQSGSTSITGVPLALFNFAFTYNGKTMAYVFPEWAQEGGDPMVKLFNDRPEITMDNTGKVTGGEGSIFPLEIVGAKGDKAPYENCIYISKDNIPTALDGNTVSNSTSNATGPKSSTSRMETVEKHDSCSDQDEPMTEEGSEHVTVDETEVNYSSSNDKADDNQTTEKRTGDNHDYSSYPEN